MTDMFHALTRGHWPSVIGAWLHLTVSFMVWLLIGGLSLTLAQDLHLSQADTALMVSLPLLSGALLRVVAGWSSDWYGAKPTGTLILVGELAVVLWGWLGVHSYAELLLIAFLLGIGGASFAVTLPLAGRTYPAAHQGLVLGIVASGNVGTVLILFFAPRIAATGGWHDVFGWMTLPIVASLAIFVLLVRDDRQSRRAERDTHWWHNVAVMIRQSEAYLALRALCRDVRRLRRILQHSSALLSRAVPRGRHRRRLDCGLVWTGGQSHPSVWRLRSRPDRWSANAHACIAPYRGDRRGAWRIHRCQRRRCADRGGSGSYGCRQRRNFTVGLGVVSKTDWTRFGYRGGGRWDWRLSLAPLVGDAERGDRFLSNRVVGVCLGYGHCLGHGAAGRTTSTSNPQDS